MATLLVCNTIAILLWTVVSKRLRRWHISGAVAMVLCGTIAGLFLRDEISEHLNTDLAEHIVELILAVLLFVDATEVRGGFLAGERSVVTRLLVVALPLSLILTGAVAIPLFDLPLFSTSSIALVLVLACIVLPVDFAPSPEMMRDRLVPRRLRHGLAVESGYNDGIFSPIFAFALLLLGAANDGEALTPAEALGHALPAAGFAVLVGVGVGGFMGAAVRLALARDWVDAHGVRVAMLLVPFVTYECTVALNGNGFVAAFLAGIAYKLLRTRGRGDDHDVPHAELALVDDLGAVASLFMWFIVGSVTALVFTTPAGWPWILFAVLALTVLRMVPVYIAFLGSRVSLRERTTLGFIGPRGTSSIVFGLLAFNALNDDDANAAIYVTVITVLGSIILHGWLGPRVLRALRPGGVGAAGADPARETT
ncbi:cation:proton antiporter [Leucobacter sp. gxy201]|uniref:cation:proton antiporter domain-containing protein n=1 Tax=Leucobacter sp. gxy201 TaxID=2957200 RepID=UPI003DA07D62